MFLNAIEFWLQGTTGLGEGERERERHTHTETQKFRKNILKGERESTRRIRTRAKRN